MWDEFVDLQLAPLHICRDSDLNYGLSYLVYVESRVINPLTVEFSEKFELKSCVRVYER